VSALRAHVAAARVGRAHVPEMQVAPVERAEEGAGPKAMNESNFDTRTPATWNDLISEFEALDEAWLFRGQSDSQDALTTTLERHTPSDLERDVAEATLLREFKRRAHTYLGANDLPATAGEWLALMQHFGAPTRLLDVTRSPYVATYFAVEDVKAECVVWAFNRHWCHVTAGASVFSAKPQNADQLRTWLEKHPDKFGEATDTVIKWMLGLEAGFLDDEASLAERMQFVVPFVPDKLTERLSVQQGEFLFPRDVKATFGENLSAMGHSEGSVKKIVLSVRLRGRALDELRRMNITRASLFPGLEGYAQSFRQLLVKETPEQKRLRLALHGLSRVAKEGLGSGIFETPVVPKRDKSDEGDQK